MVKMILVTILVFFAVCSIANSSPYSCIALNGYKGKCVSLFDCQPLLEIANKPKISLEEAYHLEHSQYGCKQKTATVCCPAQIADTPAPVADKDCFTPEGKLGQCISLHSCPKLAKLLYPPTSDDKIHYVQKSKCIGPDDNSVCCGPVPDFTTMQNGICASKASAFPPDPSSGCCGVDSVFGDHVHGDLPTTVDQYPWLAVVEHQQKDGVIKPLCGGALISAKYVLTAGHCVIGDALIIGTPTSIRLAEYDVSHDGPDCEAGGVKCTDGVTRIPIEKLIPHPEYDPANPQRWHDIAMIEMKHMAPYNVFIRPICLPTQDVTQKPDAFNLTAAGWGTANTQKNSSVKLHVHLPFINQSCCQTSYQAPGRNLTLWKGQLCAGGDPNADPCKGDSGGPLMYWNVKFYEVAGIVSFGPIPCGSQNIPSVFTKVYEYNNWIRSNIVP